MCKTVEEGDSVQGITLEGGQGPDGKQRPDQITEQVDPGRGRHNGWEAWDQVGDQERDDESQLEQCWQGWQVRKD